ncbi:dynactin subunit 3 [Triplophysa rosa]|uniref:Dynactin subunit 3 n=1 Tax=Triplophysa rosa TaxID=992332 RepID=A0A9W8C3B6_TRIRA|nr:dynactin subunit 3 [Triplophysa rosa]
MEVKNNLSGLDSRLQELEKRIYGERGGNNNKPVKCAESLTKISTALANTANKRERVKILHKKIEDLLKYLDPQFTDFIAVPDAMKFEFIIAEEEFLRSQAALLEQVHNLQPLLDSNHIKVVPELTTKVQRLSQIHIQQQDQNEELSSEVKKLFEEYNKMVSLITVKDKANLFPVIFFNAYHVVKTPCSFRLLTVSPFLTVPFKLLHELFISLNSFADVSFIQTVCSVG